MSVFLAAFLGSLAAHALLALIVATAKARERRKSRREFARRFAWHVTAAANQQEAMAREWEGNHAKPN